MNIWGHFARLGQKEYSARARIVAMAFESLIFVFGIPGSLLWIAATGGDRWRFRASPVLMAFCLVLATLGLWLGLWTVWVQFRYARGTPVPVMATKKLLTDKPYSFCRNPMALGTFVFYFSIATLTSSFRAVLAVVIFASLLIVYIKLVEEREISLRFGGEYLRYKRSTPFMIPRLGPFKRKSKA